MKITMQNNRHSHRKMCHKYAQEWAKGLGKPTRKYTLATTDYASGAIATKRAEEVLLGVNATTDYASGAIATSIWDKETDHYIGRILYMPDGTTTWHCWEHGSGWSYSQSIDRWHPDPAPIEYAGGESRTSPGQAVDYMLGHIDDIELYAEMPPIDGDETGTYEALAAEILSQAAALGIDRHHIRLHWDD